jgi:predicted hotdog family 3-hydroxylacyl-ACP dehydratase
VKRESPPDRAAPPVRGATRLSIKIPSSGPLYEGHFPGRPILPGVGLLDLALGALAAAGASPTLREIVGLRLRRLVAPGEHLELEVKAFDPDGRVRLEVRRAAEVVASGVVVLGGPPSGTGAAAPARELPSGAGSAPRAGGPRRASGVPDLDDLLPHRPPMRFVEGIETETDGGVVCAVRVPAGSAFSAGGFAPALVALEMAAQSAAVWEALRRFREAGVAGARVGYLVGARDVRFARARVPAGETLFAAVRLSGISLPLCTYAFDVALGSEVVASGTMSTWLTATGA